MHYTAASNMTPGAGVQRSYKPKCLTCGNTRAFHVATNDSTVVWNTFEPMPPAGKVVACGRCNSRNSVIMDYSD